MTKGTNIYTLKGPCSNCPFRSDKPFYLDEDRVTEIAESLRDGATFYCHKTVVYDDPPESQDLDPEASDACDDEESDPSFSGRITNRARACAGALATMEREGRPNQIMRIAHRLGFYDPENLDKDAPVYPSLAAWTAARRSDEASASGDAPQAQYCEVAHDNDCLNPPARMGAFGVEASLDGPKTTDECPACGHAMCEQCTSETDEGSGQICKQCNGEG